MNEQKQALDEGYQAVAFEVGDSLEKANARIRELEAQLAEAEKQRDGFRACQMKAGQRNIELEAQLAKSEAEIGRLCSCNARNCIDRDAAIERAEAAEARAEAKDKEWLIAYHKWYEAEARAQAMRKALEMVEWVWIGSENQNQPTDLICPWCKQRKGHPWCAGIPNQGHKPNCERQAALEPAPPIEPTPAVMDAGVEGEK
jgi:hypothetical protein